MDILVINGLDNFPTQPPPSTPYIAALLSSSNLVCKQIDLNIEVWEKLLSSCFINKLSYNPSYKEIAKEFDISILSQDEFDEYKESLSLNIDLVKNIYRSDDFYDLRKLTWADKKIEKFKTIFFYSTGYILNRYQTIYAPNPYLHHSVNDMLSFSANESNALLQLFFTIFNSSNISGQPRLAFIEIMWPWQVPGMVTLVNVLKTSFSGIHVCFSGHGFDQVVFARIINNLKNSTKHFLGFDSIFVVRNDAALLKLSTLPSFSFNELSSIPSLAYQSDGKIGVNGPYSESYFGSHIIPDYSDLNLQHYLSPKTVVIDRFSSGCFWASCNYCAINKFKGKNSSLDKEHFISRLKEYRENHNITHLFLLDEAAKPSQAREISDLMDSSGYDFIWSLRTRISKGYDEFLLKNMYDSGCRELWVGLESTNIDVLQSMNKTPDPHNYINNLLSMARSCKEIGIGLHFCLLFGFPGERISDRNDVVNFFKANYELFNRVPVFISFNKFLLSPGSDVFQNPRKYGIHLPNFSDDHFLMDDIPFTFEGMTNEEYDTDSAHIDKTELEIADLLCPNSTLKKLWHNSTDTCHEMLLKEKYSETNPFMSKIDTGYSIDLESSKWLLKRWEVVANLVAASFTHTRFNDNYTSETPIEETWKTISSRFGHKYSHVIATDELGNIVGALFCVPHSNEDSSETCDLGWFFTSNTLKAKCRVILGKEIVELAHNVLRTAGYMRVVTEMGTKEGERFLSKTHGYRLSPIKNSINRWVKELF